VVAFPEVSPPKSCMHLSLPPYLLRAPPISLQYVLYSLYETESTDRCFSSLAVRHAAVPWGRASRRLPVPDNGLRVQQQDFVERALFPCCASSSETPRPELTWLTAPPCLNTPIAFTNGASAKQRPCSCFRRLHFSLWRLEFI
jgi:hypothetical protein